MPTWLAIVIGVFVVLVILLAAGGMIARRRQLEAGEGQFQRQLEQVNQDLAAAHAADRGWEPERLEAAARAAYASQRDGAEPDDLTLVQIVDPPGKEDDKAVFRVTAGGRDEQLTLGRRGDDWVFEQLA